MRTLLMGALALLAGCIEEPQSTRQCVGDGDCPSGYICLGLRCIPQGPDRGVVPEPDGDVSMPDADTGPVMDDGPPPVRDMEPDSDMGDTDTDQGDADMDSGSPEICNDVDDDLDGQVDEALDCSLRLRGRLVWAAGAVEGGGYRLEGRGRILGGGPMTDGELTLTGDLIVGGQ